MNASVPPGRVPIGGKGPSWGFEKEKVEAKAKMEMASFHIFATFGMTVICFGCSFCILKKTYYLI